ncbi:MAG: hypothetical protein ABW003_24150 [Microvirga sp.]
MGEFCPHRDLNGGVEDGDGRIDVVISAMVTWAHWLTKKRRREMPDPKPFLPNQAAEVLPVSSRGDFLLPICIPNPGLLMGEDLAVIVFETVEGQRVGAPLGAQALSYLRETITEALRMLQAPGGGAVQ